jgi:hypothetical protein
MLMNILMFGFAILAFLGFMKVLKGDSTFAKVFSGFILASCVFACVLIIKIWITGQA